MQLKFKKLKENATLPTKAHPTDAGLDITATDDGVKVAGYLEYGTGLAVAIPEDHVGLIFPRSSVTNLDLTLKNSVGVIDSSYRGEIKFRFMESPEVHGLQTRYGLVQKGELRKYKKGDKIGQLVVVPIPKVEAVFTDDLGTTSRGSGGFGSTDVKKLNK